MSAERADESGVAAELKIDRKIDQAPVPRRRRNQQRQGAIEPLPLDIARRSAIGLEQPIQAGTGNVKATAKIMRGKRAGLEVGDMALDHDKIEMVLRPLDVAFRIGGGAACRGDDVGHRLDRGCAVSGFRYGRLPQRGKMVGQKPCMLVASRQERCGRRIRMRQPRRQRGTLQYQRHQPGPVVARARQHRPVGLGHVDQADIAGAQCQLAAPGAEPHLSLQAQGDVIMIEAATGHVRRRPVILQRGRVGIDQQGIAGHHRHRRDIEIVFRGQRDHIANAGGRRAQLL